MSALLPHSNYGTRVSEGRRLEVFSNPDDHVHGTNTGYAYGCRCDKCRSAHSAALRATAARRANGWRA